MDMGPNLTVCWTQFSTKYLNLAKLILATEKLTLGILDKSQKIDYTILNMSLACYLLPILLIELLQGCYSSKIGYHGSTDSLAWVRHRNATR